MEGQMSRVWRRGIAPLALCLVVLRAPDMPVSKMLASTVSTRFPYILLSAYLGFGSVCGHENNCVKECLKYASTAS